MTEGILGDGVADGGGTTVWFMVTFEVSSFQQRGQCSAFWCLETSPLQMEMGKKRPLEVANTHSRLYAKYTLPHFMAIYRHASSHMRKFFFLGLLFCMWHLSWRLQKNVAGKEREDEEKKGGGLDESLESHKREPRETCLSPIQPPVAVVFFLDPSTGKKKVCVCTCAQMYKQVYI